MFPILRTRSILCKVGTRFHFGASGGIFAGHGPLHGGVPREPGAGGEVHRQRAGELGNQLQGGSQCIAKHVEEP